MRILVPSGTDPHSRSRRRRRRTTWVIGWISALLLVVLYLGPRRLPPMTRVYAAVDEPVTASLEAFRADFPLRRIDVAGQIWSYVRLGDGPEAVLFLHGLSGSYDVWWQQLKELRTQYTVLSLTYGGVEGLRTVASGVLAVLDTEGVNRVHLVGASEGGYVAQYVAARAPLRTRSLVLVNSVAPPNDAGVHELGSVSVVDRLVPERTFLWRARNRLAGLHYESSQSRLVQSYVIEQGFQASRSRWFARAATALEPFEAGDLEAEGIPVLIVATDNDPVVPATATDALTGLYPHARVEVLPGAGHYPQLNRPARIQELLEAFFEAQRPDSADSDAPPPTQ